MIVASVELIEAHSKRALTQQQQQYNENSFICFLLTAAILLTIFYDFMHT